MPRTTPLKRTKTTSGRFRVANPRGHPTGRTYIKHSGRTYKEGDVFDVSSDKTDIDVGSLVIVQYSSSILFLERIGVIVGRADWYNRKRGFLPARSKQAVCHFMHGPIASRGSDNGETLLGRLAAQFAGVAGGIGRPESRRAVPPCSKAFQSTLRLPAAGVRIINDADRHAIAVGGTRTCYSSVLDCGREVPRRQKG